MKALVVLPTYNEAATIADVLRRVRSAAPEVDVLVVDDGSPDGTADLADALNAEVGHVEVMRRPVKSGLGSAYRTGFRWGLNAGYDVLMEMDADLSHDPAAIPDLLKAVEGGADIVIGTRYMPGGSIPDWPWHRRAISRAGSFYARKMLGITARDATSGFRAYHRRALEPLDHVWIRADGYAFQVEMTFRIERLGFQLVEVPITFRDRTLGKSKMSGMIVAEALFWVTAWGISDRLSGRRPPGL